MTIEEVKSLKKGSPLGLKPSDIWIKAFDEYNTDHPNDRPLNTNCRPCYWKVFVYLDKKYNQ